MKCTFYRPETINKEEFENIIGKLHFDLMQMNQESIGDYEAYNYAYRLAKQAKALDKNPAMYFWGLADPGSMPSDIRAIYFYEPTYIAAAILMKLVLLFPELMNEKGLNWENGTECAALLKKVLPGALLGCTGRGFAGGGYEAVNGLFDTMRIFAEGNVSAFVEKYPGLCPEFTKLFHETLQMIRDNTASGEWKNGWGEDYIPKAKAVLGLFT